MRRKGGASSSSIRPTAAGDDPLVGEGRDSYLIWLGIVVGLTALATVVQRDDVHTALLDVIRDERNADRSVSEIGAMLGVSKEAVQRNHAAQDLGAAGH